MAWNRAQRRQMSKYGLGEEEMKKRLNEAWNKAEEASYRTAFAAMILALYQVYHFPKECITDLARETMKRINGAFCASELVDAVKQATGFDVDEPLDEFESVEIKVD